MFLSAPCFKKSGSPLCIYLSAAALSIDDCFLLYMPYINTTGPGNGIGILLISHHSLGIIASLKPPAYLKCMLSPSILPCGGQVEDLQVAGPRSEISHLILSLQRYYCIIF